jgi:hypothetical protein
MSSNYRPPREDTKPWYRQFWPWFLIALPGSVVIAGFITLYLAMDTSDSLVKDDYFKEGLAINQDMARERIAAELGIRMELSYDRESGRMVARVNDAPMGELPHLVMALAHPTLSEQDATIQLDDEGNRTFAGNVKLESGNVDWHVVVSPPGETWKLRGRWNPVVVPQLTLAPAGSDQAG